MTYYDGNQADKAFKAYASLKIVSELILPYLKVNVRDGLAFYFSDQSHLDTLNKNIEALFLRLREEDKDLEEIQKDIQTLVRELHT